MRLVDTHAHLTFKAFKRDLDQVIERARRAGVVFIVNATLDAEDFTKALRIAQRYKGYIYVALGCAAQTVSESQLESTLDAIERYRGQYVAIGECGLDWHWVKDEERREFARRAFRVLAEKARDLDVPLIVHCREAFDDVMRILREVKPDRLVFHAFSDTPQNALEVVRHGWYVSVPTIVCRSELHQKVARVVPLEHLVLETDSPFLSPYPRTRNEPANVRVAAEFIARLRGIAPEEFAERTTENACELFGVRL